MFVLVGVPCSHKIVGKNFAFFREIDHNSNLFLRNLYKSYRVMALYSVNK